MHNNNNNNKVHGPNQLKNVHVAKFALNFTKLFCNLFFIVVSNAYSLYYDMTNLNSRSVRVCVCVDACELRIACHAKFLSVCISCIVHNSFVQLYARIQVKWACLCKQFNYTTCVFVFFASFALSRACSLAVWLFGHVRNVAVKL